MSVSQWPFSLNLQNIINPKKVEQRELKFWEDVQPQQHISCHMSHVMCCMWHIFFDKVVKLMGWGYVINGAFSVLFKILPSEKNKLFSGKIAHECFYSVKCVNNPLKTKSHLRNTWKQKHELYTCDKGSEQQKLY